HRARSISRMRRARYGVHLRDGRSEQTKAEQTSCWKPLLTTPARRPEKLGVMLGPKRQMETAARQHRSELSSLLPFCKIARPVMDLCLPRQIDAAKIQSFLEQTKPATEIGQRMYSTGCA